MVVWEFVVLLALVLVFSVVVFSSLYLMCCSSFFSFSSPTSSGNLVSTCEAREKSWKWDGCGGVGSLKKRWTKNQAMVSSFAFISLQALTLQTFILELKSFFFKK